MVGFTSFAYGTAAGFSCSVSFLSGTQRITICNNNASYALNVHSCCHLVINVHILVSPNDGCPCMWSGVVRQSNLDSTLREVPYTSLRRTAGRQGRPPPLLITRSQLAASLTFPWLKTCYNCWWVLCVYIFNDNIYILARCRIYILMLINQIVCRKGNLGNAWLGCTSTVIHHTYCILTWSVTNANTKENERYYE